MGPTVKILDGLQLQLHIPVMSGLVAGLHMQVDEVTFLQSLYRGLRLPFVIRVVQTGSPFHVNHLQAGITADAANQVHRRDDGPGMNLRIGHGQRCHGRAVASAPRPNAVGRVTAFLLALQVQGMARQQLLRLQYQAVQQVGRLPGFRHFGLHHAVAERRTRHVMRGRAAQPLVSALDDQ